MKRISFIILHYGDINITKKCVDSIKRLITDHIINVIIVDNDCDKNNAERGALKKIFQKDSNIKILEMHVDKGFSYANNKGYSFAVKKQHADYIVMANNDIVFCQKDFLKKIEESYKTEKYAVLAPDIIGLTNKEHQNPIDRQGRTKKQLTYTIIMNAVCLGLFPVIYPLLYVYDLALTKKKVRIQKKEHDNYKMMQYNIVPCGACLVFSEIFIQQEKQVFCPETEFYYEEYILHHNCRTRGYKIIYDPSVCVLHMHGAATKGKVKTKKNKMKFILKNTLKSAIIYKRLVDGK